MKLEPIQTIVRSAFVVLCVLAAPALCAAEAGASAGDSLQALQKRWAEIKYRTAEKQQVAAFAELSERAQAATAAEPTDAALWVWSGIIRASYAGAKGGLGALSAVKAAKADLEHAIAIDGSVQNGAAYTSLGSLYYQVPGWPIGFGDDKKAETLLQKGLEYGNDDVDANYFYADYLFSRKDYQRALEYAQKAEHSSRDLSRPLASEGRQGEIQQLKTRIMEKLH